MQGTSAAAPFVARQLAETFVTATNEDVEKAKYTNYQSLLEGFRPDPKKDPLKVRLGAVRVEPHWQPGLRRRRHP